jgi:Flp pilus assembly protein TadD
MRKFPAQPDLNSSQPHPTLLPLSQPGRNSTPAKHRAAHQNLLRAQQMIRSGDTQGALRAFARAIEFEPRFGVLHIQLGQLQHSMGENRAARTSILRGLRFRTPGTRIEPALALLCTESESLEERDEACAYLQHACDHQKLTPAEFRVVGFGLAVLGDNQRAIHALTQSLVPGPELTPGLEQDATCWTELGACYLKLRNLMEGELCLREAIRLDPEHPAAHTNLGMCLLLKGDYLQGFREFEWRLQMDNFFRIEGFDAPRWQGEPLAGKTILLHGEQGFGDSIQFLRYIPHVAALGAKVVIAAQPQVFSILASVPGVWRAVELGTALPPIHYHCPLMSLPAQFATTLQSIPPVVPIEARELPLTSTNSLRPLRVGLVWSGNPKHPNDRARSRALREFAPLAASNHVTPGGVQFVSLQQGTAAAQLNDPSLPFAVQDACSTARDFAETAAVIASLDLVIAVDTAVAHLAATMLKPVWVLLGSVPEWRWGMEGDKTPWYPNLRIFRATKPEDWPKVIALAADSLRIASAGFRALQLQPSPG